MALPSIRSGRAGPAGAEGYRYLREALDDRFASLPPEDIEQLVADLFGPGVEAEDVEDILGSIGRAFGSIAPALGNLAAQAGPALARAAGPAASGALTGAGIAGPYGALAGGIIGGLSSLLGGGGPPTPSAAPAPAAPAAPPSVAAPPVPAASPAAGQLLSVLSRPETLQALLSMLMGQAGQSPIRVGSQGTQVGPGAFTNLLGVLANQASAEYRLLAPHAGEGVPRYLLERVDLDPAVPEHQAEALYALLREADRTEALAARRLTRYRPVELDETDEVDEADLEAAIAWGALMGAQDVLGGDEWDESDD